MEERRSGEYHRIFARMIAVVKPRQVLTIPGVIASGKAHNTFPVLPPDTEAKDDLVMAKEDVVVERQNSFSLDNVQWKKTIIQAISFGFVNL